MRMELENNNKHTEAEENWGKEFKLYKEQNYFH